MFLLTKYQNPEAVIVKLLRCLNIRIEPNAIIAGLEKHSDYPSLSAVSDLSSAFDTEKSIIRKALHYYEQKQKDYAAWAKIYPVQLKGAKFYELEKQQAWVEMAEVTATPQYCLTVTGCQKFTSSPI